MKPARTTIPPRRETPRATPCHQANRAGVTSRSRGRHGRPPGIALVLALVFLAMFAALTAAMAAFSGADMQIAANLHRADATRACAESGLEVMRFWIGRVDMSGKIAHSERFSHLATSLQSSMTANLLNRLTCTSSTITLTNVPLHSSRAESFSAVLTKVDNDNVRLEVTGHCGALARTLRTDFQFQETANTVFDYGVVTRGPLSLQGSVDITGVNINVESNAYIESPNTLLALQVGGSSEIAGNVKIANPSACVSLGSHASVGGATGAAAMEHISIGVPPSSFPDMDPGLFTGYATNVLSPTLDLKKAQTLTNIRIPPNTNPKFTGKATINGVLFIQTPNVVEFAGGASITGVIVTNGDPNDNSGANQLKFTGNVDTQPVTQLPSSFGDLRTKTGTFIMAPGCAVSFSGSFTTLNGAIAANGVSFSGNAGGMIHGSVINYANNTMTLSGNSDLLFNRSGLDQIPAGFVPQIVLYYVPSSYAEAPS